MSLLKPTPGQIADRHAVLLIKRDKFLAADKSVAHLNREIIELSGLLPGIAFQDDKTNLYSLHLAMWMLVDEVAVAPNDIAAVAAKRLHSLNLKRHSLIAKIDQSFGQHEGDEKLT